ncbi:dinuclear metal center protein, YbgI/SA1388 family [Methylobacillus rhizosphaerae]|uniref:Dinuclear metal center protein, YbgI/SA1388 family n=1 Tax=Methylobacillus rhizosphaerae TaxID=551994 RepID=A0A238Z4R0_9PROT|nr:Nif3-like dinuclear metal center hexameric protein [Methylobacillus rhizosphaerae]SNR77948.1 dinuclear metal center protein, YbgI/SA1388 family [Methylobacillus rhizosphaerae]
MKLKELVDYTGQFLEVDRFKDYCPNGLQVQGRSEVNKIVSGVTASMDLLEAARDAQADAILVHHGYFWRNESPVIAGIKHKRLKFLLQNDISLLAYHLPLDAHRTLGNNARIGQVLDLVIEGWTGEQGLIAYGCLPHETTLESFAEHLGARLLREPQIFGEKNRKVKRVAWCSGGAQGYFETAIALGVDAYISGEVSEQIFHLAHETGVAYIAAGHHATERYGIAALGNHLASEFGVEHEFIDLDNPI